MFGIHLGAEEGLIPLRRLPPWLAATLLAVVVTLIAAGLAIGAHPRPGPPPNGSSDVQLYRQIVEDVAGGKAYYAAAAKELRRGGYPLRPFLAMRPPLLAALLARLPGEAARRGVLAGLVMLTLAVWAWRLRDLLAVQPMRYACAIALLFTGLAPGLSGPAYVFHEVWAAALIALSLAMHDPRRWWPSLLLGLAAGLIRELAIPYLAVMALFALLEGRRREAAAWVAAVAVVAVALMAHAMTVAVVTTPMDRQSPGWLGLGGWPFILRTVQWNVVVSLAPRWFGAALLPPALLGLLAWPGPLARRVAAITFGFLAGFCFFGRADNFYWGLMIAPLWPLGLFATDSGLKTLVARARLVVPKPVALA